MTGNGRLVIVGTGFKAAGHCTPDAQYEIETADIVYASLPDALAFTWLRSIRSDVHDFSTLYQSGKSRWQTYRDMVQLLTSEALSGKKVCAVFYGHPGVFVTPSHAAIRILREHNIEARMLPGISAEDCLFADLGVDPGLRGCQSLEASSFLLYHHPIDSSQHLILWQIGALADLGFINNQPIAGALETLVNKLSLFYPTDHQICLYEAASWEIQSPRQEWWPISALPQAMLHSNTTLLLPPCSRAKADLSVFEKLGLAVDAIPTVENIDDSFR
jgi:uncharacterized protein YabN with tetrapyrrole methylase and pyrophosphatase domain